MADIILSTSKQYTDFLKSEMHARLTTNNYFNDTTINFLGDIIGQAVDQNKKELAQIYSSSLLSKASGIELEVLVYNLFGLIRRPASYATSFKEEKNVMFYVNSQSAITFGDINNGQDILIPKGTLIGSSSAFDSFDNAVYSVIVDTILPANSSTKFVDVIAATPGSPSLVSETTLINHNFSNYFDNSLNSLRVTNRFPIINGSNTETDDDLRNRAVHFVDSQRVGSLDSITSSALSIPGVLNAIIIPGYYGIGTTAVVCKGVDQESSIRLVSDVQKTLDTLNLLGGNFYAILPVYISLNLKLRLDVSESISTQEIDNLKNLIKSEVFTFARNNISQFVNLNSLSNELARKVSISSTSKAALVKNNSTQFGDSVFFEINISKNTGSTESAILESVTNLQLFLKQEEVLSSGDIQIEVITK
jgi:hypothetical protein